ncbi:MAG: hypothetical protein QFB86_01620 [Patescibacteria group bacterium]|nr:hypothetical protein [Patescibacteria group bacterium]
MIKNIRYIFVAALLTFSFLMPTLASAAKLTQVGVRLGRLGISSGSGGASDNNDLLVTFKLNTTPTSVGKISIAFPSGFNMTAGTPAVSTTGFPATPASITAPPGTLTAAVTTNGANAGGAIVVSGLTSASLVNSTLYGFIIPAGSITNPATAGQYVTTVESQTSGGATIDSTTAPTYVYGASSNQDQVVVSASVSPNFSFALSANTDTVPAADPSAIVTSPGVTMSVGTNSPLGYTAYVKSKNAALTSAATSGSITGGTFNGTADTTAAGTTHYGFLPITGTACGTCTGTLTYDGEYSGGGGAFISAANQSGAFNGTSFSSFVSRSGYTNSDQFTLKERVTVANTVPYANDYTDTLTIVAAGNF